MPTGIMIPFGWDSNSSLAPPAIVETRLKIVLISGRVFRILIVFRILGRFYFPRPSHATFFKIFLFFPKKTKTWTVSAFGRKLKCKLYITERQKKTLRGRAVPSHRACWQALGCSLSVHCNLRQCGSKSIRVGGCRRRFGRFPVVLLECSNAYRYHDTLWLG